MDLKQMPRIHNPIAFKYSHLLRVTVVHYYQLLNVSRNHILREMTCLFYLTHCYFHDTAYKSVGKCCFSERTLTCDYSLYSSNVNIANNI